MLTATAVLCSALGSGAATGPTASAQPAQAPAEAIAACTQFARALDLASLTYSGFADVIALGEVYPDYSDPLVSSTNTSGRTGLRAAVSTALSASRTPGLAPQLAAPMRSWALAATKLLLLMGLRADVDRFNAAAAQVNEDTENAQRACAEAGTRA